MYLDNKKLFLAGSTGLAGSSILQYILNNYPTTRIRASTYKHTNPFIKDERVEYIYCDLRSPDDYMANIKGCDCAIMAAAYTGGSNMLISQPEKYITENVIMNVPMLEAFHFANVKRVVYLGSATLYQESDKHIAEDELDLNRDPSTAYMGIGWVTRFMEKVCKFWYEKYGMEVIIARVSNIFGPYAKFNPHNSNFIPAIIRKAVDKMDPFEVWGSPDVTRDVIYSEDLGSGVTMMMDDDKIKFDIFNIGSGVKTTVEEIVKWALKYADHTPSEVKYISDKPTTSKFRAIDCTKVEKVLGWKPRYTIEEGVKKTTQWWMQNRRWWEK